MSGSELDVSNQVQASIKATVEDGKIRRLQHLQQDLWRQGDPVWQHPGRPHARIWSVRKIPPVGFPASNVEPSGHHSGAEFAGELHWLAPNVHQVAAVHIEEEGKGGQLVLWVDGLDVRGRGPVHARQPSLVSQHLRGEILIVYGPEWEYQLRLNACMPG